MRSIRSEGRPAGRLGILTAALVGLFVAAAPAQNDKSGPTGAGATPGKTADEKVPSPNVPSPKGPELKGTEEKAPDPKVGDPKVADPKVGDEPPQGGRTAESKTAESKTADSKTGDGTTKDGSALAATSPAGETPEKTAAAVTLARITAEQAQVRCFSSPHSPVYEGSLPKGTVVRVDRAEGEFCRVHLPLGVIGYVSKKFTTAPEQGMVRTNTSRVSFRYRPTPPHRAEQPVQRLEKDTPLKYLGEIGEWWKVRFATESAYLPINAVQTFTEANATLEKSLAELQRSHEAEWKEAVGTFEAAVALAKKRAEQRARIDDLQKQLAEESKKAYADQTLDPILTAVGAIIADLPEDADLLGPAVRLRKATESQKLLAQAQVLLNTENPEPPPTRVPIRSPVKDKLGHLKRIGWLSYHPRSPGAEAFRLMKGDRVIAYLKCSSMRYDLSIFDGVEIGVSGQSKQGELQSYIDVEQVEVLGHAR